MTDARAHSSGNKKKIIWFLVILVVVGGLIAACAISASANDAPMSFISSSYTRTPSLDEGGNKAYTTTKSVQTVKSEITAKSKPVDSRTSSTDQSVWLQYSDDIVALFPYNGGTKIMADDYDRMYSHYHSTYIIWWSSSRPHGWYGGGSGSGSNWRGGGSGSGK